MATKEQHDFFRFLYEEEERRYSQLEGRAKLYLSVIAIFLATLIFKIDDVEKSIELLRIPWSVVLVQAALQASSLVFVVFGVFIREYEGIADPEEIVAGFGEAPPTNEAFFDDRIADYVVATNRNAAANDKAARFLEIAVFLLGSAMLLMLGMIVTRLFK